MNKQSEIRRLWWERLKETPGAYDEVRASMRQGARRRWADPVKREHATAAFRVGIREAMRHRQIQSDDFPEADIYRFKVLHGDELLFTAVSTSRPRIYLSNRIAQARFRKSHGRSITPVNQRLLDIVEANGVLRIEL